MEPCIKSEDERLQHICRDEKLGYKPSKSMRHTSNTDGRAQHSESGKLIWESLAARQWRLMLWW